MMRTGRDVEVGLDTIVTQTLDQSFRAEVLLAAAAEIQVMNPLVELVRSGKHPMVCRLHVQSEDGTAEGTHPCELIHVVQDKVEGLVSSHDRPAIARWSRSVRVRNFESMVGIKSCIITL